MNSGSSITISGTNINLSSLLSNTGSITSDGMMYGDKKLIDVKIKDITVEVLYRQSANFIYTVYGQNSNSSDRVWKEIYGLKDGKMTLLEVVKGKHNKAQNIPESFEFDDQED